MALALSVQELAKKTSKETQDKLAEASSKENLNSLEVSSASLADGIRQGTVTPEEIDSFLAKTPQILPYLKEYLLCKKAWLFLRQDRGQEALKHFDLALDIKPESPSTWARKGAALLELARPDEAFQCFEKAYSYRDNFGEDKPWWMKLLFTSWGQVALLRGLSGVYNQQVQEAENGVLEYISIVDKARAEKLERVVVTQFQESPAEPWSHELREAFAELELMVRLLSIKDPFEGWRALGKELSKVWPKGISAVDAIREQRK